MLARTAHQPPTSLVLARVLRAQLGIDELFRLPEVQSQLPLSHAPICAGSWHRRVQLEGDGTAAERPPPTADEQFLTLEALHRAYEAGLSPVSVVERALAAITELEHRMPSMNPFAEVTQQRALSEAAESAERYRQGRPRGLWDGVLVPVKEEIGLHGLTSRLGAQVLPDAPEAADALCVQRLRAQGAIVLGHTVMTEFGMSTLGVNPLRNMPRNVYDPERLAGGSSTGSAVAVALGLSPVAVGTDGGGSLRVPAAYNGLFALKPTFGRIPLLGHGARAGSSVVHIGPIARCARDLAEFLDVAAGPPSRDDEPGLPPLSAEAGPPSTSPGFFRAALGRPASSLTIAVDESLWAQADEDLASCARAGLAALERAGATIRRVSTQLLRHAPALGYVSIGVESLAALKSVLRYRERLGDELKVTLAGLSTLAPDEYVTAQRIRGALRRELAELFTSVDLLALPTTASLPPVATESEMRGGILDTHAVHQACQFSFLANLTGVPAGTAPVGELDGMPVGLQLVADAWDESAIITAFAELEAQGAIAMRAPPGIVDLLTDD